MEVPQPPRSLPADGARPGSKAAGRPSGTAVVETSCRWPWRLSVAPMMDWSDRHCRYFHRLLSGRTRLYTEMITTGALLHGDVPRHLDFDAVEQPLALQLGGSEAGELAACARLGERWGYAEINLNCGCPSERVQRGAFGACLMSEPRRVAEGVRAMRDAVSIPVTVKHRIGVDRQVSYDFVRDFVGTVAEVGGAEVFIVHARNAWLDGVSAKDNRELPPLRYDVVARLAGDFPRLGFVLNGGIASDEQVASHLERFDGVMIGRMAYHEPWRIAAWDERFLGGEAGPRRDEVEAAMVDYMLRRRVEAGTPWPRIARHMLGLRHGEPGARRWRRVWSDPALREESPGRVADRARAALRGGAEETAGVGPPAVRAKAPALAG